MMATEFSEIPIEELCTKVTSGLTPLRSRSDFYENGTIDWYKTGELNDWYLEPAKERIADRAFKETSIKLFPTDTVLMAMYGDGKTITSMGILRAPAATNQACAAMFVDRKKCHPRYFFYALKSRRELLLKIASGGAQRNLSGKLMKEFQLPIPPLPVQQRIADILSAYDELIENSQRRIKILEAMARGLYREWFVHFRFPGFENHPRVASALGEIPQEWEVKQLGELCSKLMDGTHDSPPPVEVGFPLITGRHIRDGFIDFSDAYQISPEEHQKVMKRSRPECGDIIYSNIGTLGAIAIVDQDFEFSIKNVALLKPLTRAHTSFLYCFLAAPEKLSELTNKASGTSQKFFSLQFLRTLELFNPPEALLEKFSEKLEPILRTRSLLMKGIQNLRRTRDLLLPRLLSGQINVEAP